MIPVIIPARMASTRFPGKPMAKIHGQEMILHVCKRAAAAVGNSNVIVATDSRDVLELVIRSGFKSLMTSENCLTGTDRVAEAMRVLGLKSAINVQGDEPLVDPLLIQEVALKLNLTSNVIHAYAPLSLQENPLSTSIPKVAVGVNSKLLYASRSAVPLNKSGIPSARAIFKQVCVYGYHLENLDHFGSKASKSPLEQEEDIEILRFLEHGIPVEMIRSDVQSIAVDFPEDITLVESVLKGL